MIRLTLSRVLTLVVVLTFALPWTALADNVIADGDGVSPVATNPLAFGTVCKNTTPSKSILVAIDANGHPGAGNNVFANGAIVSFGTPAVTGGLLASNPGSITLPGNWTTLSNTAMSAASSGGVSLSASATSILGSASGTVTYTATGPRSNDPSQNLSRSATLNASWNVVNCDQSPPTLSLPADITAEATSATGAIVTFTATASDANPTNPVVTCSPASGSTFALGTTTVSCSAVDAAGNVANGSFSINVVDTTAPSLSGTPDDITVEAAGASGTIVNYTDPTASDNVGPASPAVSCAPASGSTFSVGSTTVTCSATDNAGNTGTSSFTVNVADTTAPTLVLPADITEEATGQAGAAVTFATSASDLVDGAIVPSCDANSGDTFALGTTTVSCTATDTAGNPASGTFDITIVDTTAPDIAGTPSNQTLEATGPSGADATWTTPTASDLVDGVVAVDCDHDSGDTFALGITTVHCSATDNAGNSSSSSFSITVQDTTPPTIDGSVDQMIEATGPTGASANFSLTASDLVDGSVEVTCNHESGETFPLGDTPISCSATDDAGNKATASFTITVEDTTPPEVTVPLDITKEATGPSGAVVNYTASATDIVDSNVSPDCSPASGSTFSLGSTPVSCTATDSAGNTSLTASFSVTVVDTTAPTLTVPSSFTVQATGPSGAVVTYTASATDIVDSNVTPDCSPASGSTFSLGSTAVSCTATDNAGNTSPAKTFNVHVALQTSGFYQPVDMNGVWNTVKNGSTVPLKFELFAGATELSTTSYVQGFSATPVTCPTNGYLADAIEVLATGSTVLRYDSTAGQFVYNWQTPKKAGSCYRITMTATDGSTISANFILK